MVKTVLLMHRAQIQSLVQEQRSHMPQDMVNSFFFKKGKNNSLKKKKGGKKGEGETEEISQLMLSCC